VQYAEPALMSQPSPAVRPAAPNGMSNRVLWLALAVLVMFRAVLLFRVAPIGDEAYYWLWGQHPDLSYFDHPPLNAWLMGLVSQVFGWNLFSLRLVGWLSTAGTLYLFHLWARRLAGEYWLRWFLIASVIYLASPLYAVFSGIMFPDHLLIVFSLWSLYAFAVFFESWEAGAPRWRPLFIAAFALGLAALSKYSAVFVAIAVMLHIVLAPRRWGILKAWQLYAAALLIATMLTPVLAWNLQHDFASFRFHLIARQGDFLANLAPERALSFLVLFLAYLSPLLVWPIARLVVARPESGFAGASRDVGRLVFFASTLSFAWVAMGSWALPYWNILAVAPLVPHLVAAIGARVQLMAHIGYGLIVVGLLFLVNFTLVPVATLTGGSDWESSVVHGWDEIAAEVAAAEVEHGPDFLAATRYTLAAQLAFARGRDDVTALSSRVDQFDFWFDPEAHRGQAALILADTTQTIDAETQARFAEIEEVRRFDVVRFGHVVNTYVLFVARGFGGAAP
jgi:4-amino-4-deoxy-L-arabinose transferase-like glycosyltransferase